jgi:hypothetical protein
MEFVVIATVLAGVITGRFFKVFILIPVVIFAAAVAVAVVWLRFQPAEISLLNYAGEVCLLIISLEAGYFAGNLLSGISLQSRKLNRFRVRPRH